MSAFNQINLALDMELTPRCMIEITKREYPIRNQEKSKKGGMKR